MNELLPDFNWELVPAGEKILVAASGGADSQTLLWALHESGREILASHINHGWRAEASDSDERFVLGWCQSQNIQAISWRVSCAHNEDAARRVRYQALIEMARENNCARIAVGHTATDGLETALLNLSRGASVEGLAGIPPLREISEGIFLVRPLWRTTREMVRRALGTSGWPHVEDASNDLHEFKRNRIRLLLPQLGEVETIALQHARAGEILRDDVAYLDELARSAMDEIRVSALPLRGGHPNSDAGRNSTVLSLDGDGFRALNIALQRRVLREAARVFSEVPTSEHIEIARRHVAAIGKRVVWCWPNGVRCEWTGAFCGNRVRVWRVEI